MTFAQRRNRPTTHFSERVRVVKRRISINVLSTYISTGRGETGSNWQKWPYVGYQ